MLEVDFFEAVTSSPSKLSGGGLAEGGLAGDELAGGGLAGGGLAVETVLARHLEGSLFALVSRISIF